MQDLCVKLFNSWKLKIDFLFPLRASTLRLEPRSRYFFVEERVTWKALGTRLPYL